jgi:hypothetical protein
MVLLPSPRGRSTTAVQIGGSMIVKLMDRPTGAPVYINPAYVETLRPDPADRDDDHESDAETERLGSARGVS